MGHYGGAKQNETDHSVTRRKLRLCTLKVQLLINDYSILFLNFNCEKYCNDHWSREQLSKKARVTIIAWGESTIT